MVLEIALISNSDVMAPQTVQTNRMRLAVSFVERINNILRNFSIELSSSVLILLFWFFILQLVISTQNFPARTAPDAFLVKTYVIGLRIVMINLMRRMVGRNVVSLNFINYQDILLKLFYIIWVSAGSFNLQYFL